MKQSGFKFTNPKVTKFVFETNPLFSPGESQTNISNMFEVEISKSEKENEAIVQLNVLIGTKKFGKEDPFYVDMTIGAKFFWDDVYDEETIHQLLSINAPSLLLGYARPIVSQITASSPFTTYTLPFYNFLAD